MANADYVKRPIHLYFQDAGSFVGVQVSVANSSGANAVTSTDLRDAFWGGNKTDYQAGLTQFNIPLEISSGTGGDPVVEKCNNANQPIYAAVVGGSTPTIAASDMLGTSTGLDALNNYSTGNPERLTVAHRGCGRMMIFKYTGTAPDPTAADETAYVVTSGTAGKVKVAASESNAQFFGSRVIAVDTTLELVAVMF